LEGSDGVHASRILRVASDIAPVISPLLKRTPKIKGVRYVRGPVKVEPNSRRKK